MKPSFSKSALILALYATGTLGTPAPGADVPSAPNNDGLKPRQGNIDWDFTLYQNLQCTGAADRYSGVDSQGCTTGIRNGNAPAFTKAFIDADCEVILFSDNVCTPANAIEVIDETTDTTCSAPVGGGAVASFQVDC